MVDIFVILMIVAILAGFYKIVSILEIKENKIKSESLTKFHEDIENRLK